MPGNPQNILQILRKRWLLVGFGALVAAMIVFAATGIIPKKPESAGPLAPGFILRDQQRRLTSLEQFRGKVVLLTFLDPECRQICPLTTNSMVEAVRMLGPAAAGRVELLGVNVNLNKARTADVAAYSRIHELPRNWRFLTGPAAQLEQVWLAYHIHVAVSRNGDVEHSALTYIIGPEGHEHGAVTTLMSYTVLGDEARELAGDMAPFLPHASVPPRVPQTSDLVAEGKTPLSAIGPKPVQVSFGKSHPHLVAFFASWLGTRAKLKQKLSAFDQYALVARQRHWPSVVAVDEVPTEPSAAAARQALTSFGPTLRTPIVQDAHGELADEYQVQDLPWIELSAPSGKILWYHDGWIDAARLERRVRAALAAATRATKTKLAIPAG